MAWERRARGVRYYTRSRRVGGRVVREYVGSGPHARLAAMLDEIDREERDRIRSMRRRDRARADALDEALRSHGAALDRLVAGMLESHGYHCHKGEWRRKRA